MPLRRLFWKMVCATAMKIAPPRVWKKDTQAVPMGTSERGTAVWTTRMAAWKPTPVGGEVRFGRGVLECEGDLPIPDPART